MFFQTAPTPAGFIVGMGSRAAGTRRSGVAERVRRLVLVVVTVCGLAAPQAGAATRSRTAVAGSNAGEVSIASGVQITRKPAFERTGKAALERITFPYREMLPGWEIVFRPSRRGYLGLTFKKARRIEIYVRPERSVNGIAHDIAHEVGHAVDLTYNTPESRARYLALRNRPASLPWWTCSGCTDLQVGAGDFAETFAQWATTPYRFYSELGEVPNADTVSAIAAEIYPGAITAAVG